MAHFVMDKKRQRPVASELGVDYEGAGVPQAESKLDRPQPSSDSFFCGLCSPPRPFSSEHAKRTHVGKVHPAEKARRAHMDSVKVRKEQNAARKAAE